MSTTDPRPLPAGFAPVDDAPLLRDTDEIVKPEALARGARLTLSESVLVPKGPQSYKLYLFRHEKYPAVRFGVWSTAQLDRLLKDVKPGEEVFLRYDGKQPNPRVEGGTLHTWFLARPQTFPAAVDPTNPDAGAMPVLD